MLTLILTCMLGYDHECNYIRTSHTVVHHLKKNLKNYAPAQGPGEGPAQIIVRGGGSGGGGGGEGWLPTYIHVYACILC